MHDFAIAAPMWIRTTDEANLVFHTVSCWSALSYPVVLVDAGSPRDSLEKIGNLPNVHLYQSNRPFSGQIQLALHKASTYSDSVVFCQSDKLEFAKKTLKPMIEYYKSSHHKKLLIAKRSHESITTYPPFQRHQEEFLNQTIAKFTQKSGDYLAGPKIFPSLLMQYLPHIKGELGWGIEFFLTIIAHRLSIPIEFFEFFMKAPTDIGSEEEIEKYRIKITQWELEGLLQGLAIQL